MADSAQQGRDLYPSQATPPPTPAGVPTEAAFLGRWDDDVKRAAHRAAGGDAAYADDLAQEARIRLLLVNRAHPGAPTSYLRMVIVNALRSAVRPERRSFSTRSALAEEFDEELIAPAEDSADLRAMLVAAWASRLPPRLRDVYRHLYTEGRSQRETARLMRLSQPRVAQLHQHLIQLGQEELAHLAE